MGTPGLAASDDQASSGNYINFGNPDNKNVVIKFQFPKGNPFVTIRKIMNKQILIFERVHFLNKFSVTDDPRYLVDILQNINHHEDPYLTTKDLAKTHFSKRSLLTPIIRLKTQPEIYDFNPDNLGDSGKGQKIDKNMDRIRFN